MIGLSRSRALLGLVEAVEADAKTKGRLRFAIEQWMAASAPSNFMALNAEAQQKALETQGESIARGMQNKVLEAMASGKAVVVGKAAMGGIHAEHGRDLFVAETPEEFRDALNRLLADPALVESMGKAARAYILAHLSWETNLEHGLMPLLSAPGP